MSRPRRPPSAAEPLVGVGLLAGRWIERLLGAHEPQLTPAQFLALRTIAREPVTSAELARRTGVSGAAVSQLIAVVDQAGWIERTHAPADRRHQVLALTPAGKRVYASSSGMVNARLSELLVTLPQPEADRLRRLLERLEQTLGGTPPPRRPPPPPPRRRR